VVEVCCGFDKKGSITAFSDLLSSLQERKKKKKGLARNTGTPTRKGTRFTLCYLAGMRTGAST
jgi:hypothetical protein